MRVETWQEAGWTADIVVYPIEQREPEPDSYDERNVKKHG